jgi:hypothetical protein
MGEKEQMRSLSLSSRIYNDTANIHDVQEDECRINNNNNNNNNNSNNGIKHRTNRTIEHLLVRKISNTSDSSLSSSKNKLITFQQSLFLLFLVISVIAFISEFFATSNSQNNNRMSRSRSSDSDAANNPIHIQNGFYSVVGKSKSNDLLVQSSGGILTGINYVEEEEAKQLKAKQLKATEEEAKQRKAKEVEEEAKQHKAKEEEAKQRKAKEVEEEAKQHKAKEAKQLKAKEEEAKQRKAVPGGGGGTNSSSSSSSSMIVTTTIPHCILDDGPIPVILMTMGRSGSTGIWQALGKLTGYDTFNEGKAKLEYVGEDQIQQQQFFHDKKWEGRKDKNGQWLLHYMCKLRHTTFKDATFVGFKWKSWLEFLLTKEGKNTLQLIALLAKDEYEEEDQVITSLHDSSTTTTTVSSSTGSAVTTAKQRQRQRSPPIRVIRSRRNPIDVQLSFYKHRLYTRNKRKDKGGNGAVQYLPAHCKDNDTDCLQKHYELGEHQIIQNLDQFFKDTYQRWNEENKIDLLLVEMNVPVIFLSYDTLYYPSSKEECGDGENEWNQALNFVRGGVISNSNNDNSNSNNSNSNTSNSNGSSNNNTNKTETVCMENIDSEYYKSWKQIQDSMGYGSTTRTRNHKELISNWLEVQQKFMGTSLEQFLRLS